MRWGRVCKATGSQREGACLGRPEAHPELTLPLLSGASHTTTQPARAAISGTSEEWRDEAQPSWVRRLVPSQLSLLTVLGGGNPLEFRFRLLWLRAGGESGAGAQLVLQLCAFLLSVTRACCCSGGAALPLTPVWAMVRSEDASIPRRR